MLVKQYNRLFLAVIKKDQTLNKFFHSQSMKRMLKTGLYNGHEKMLHLNTNRIQTLRFN
jgi:hypothetical protein